MVRFLVVYDRPPDPDAFDRHYREVHIPLTKALPGMRRFTLSRNASPIRGGEPFYLVAEVDFDDMDALRAAFASSEGQAAAADVPTFAPTGVLSMIFELEEP